MLTIYDFKYTLCEALKQEFRHQEYTLAIGIDGATL